MLANSTLDAAHGAVVGCGLGLAPRSPWATMLGPPGKAVTIGQCDDDDGEPLANR